MVSNDIIYGALKKSQKLVLPGLGALLKKTVGEDVEYVFTQFLKDDDGVLTEEIQKSYNVTQFEAEEMLSELVKDITTKIAVNGDYVIPNIGRLSSDKNGSIKLKKLPIVNAVPVVSEEPSQHTIVQQPQMAKPAYIPQPVQPLNSQPQVQEPQRRPMIHPQPIVGVPPVHPQPTAQQAPKPQAPMSQRQNMRPPQPRPVMQSRPQGSPYSRPVSAAKPKVTKSPKKKNASVNKFLIIAMIVALVALSLIVYDLFFAGPTVSELMAN